MQAIDILLDDSFTWHSHWIILPVIFSIFIHICFLTHSMLNIESIVKYGVWHTLKVHTYKLPHMGDAAVHDTLTSSLTTQG